MPVLHKNLTDPEIHEPKGVTTALPGTVYVANGMGGGQWKKLELDGVAGTVAGALPNDGLAIDGSGGIRTFARFASASAGWSIQEVVGNIPSGVFLDRSAPVAYNTTFEGTRIRCKYAGMYRVVVRFKMRAPRLNVIDNPIYTQACLRMCSNNAANQGPWIVTRNGDEEQILDYYLPVGTNGDIDLRWCTVGGVLTNWPGPAPVWNEVEYLFITAVLVAGGITP